MHTCMNSGLVGWNWVAGSLLPCLRETRPASAFRYADRHHGVYALSFVRQGHRESIGK